MIPIMKRFLYTILSVLLLANSCVDAFRDEITELHGEIDNLRNLIEQTNSNVEALQAIVTALRNNDYVTGITPIVENGVEIGYSISFSRSGMMTIYHGNDGNTPEIGVRKDTDGLYYWTLEGSWLLDGNGQKVKAGAAPQLKIEDGYWYITYNEGESWIELGKASGDDGDAFFSDITVTEGEVIFTLADGTELIVPKNTRVRITLDVPEKETGVLPGSEIQINYTLENATDSTFVTASSNGNYSVRVEAFDRDHGRIIVRSPYIYVDGYINIMVSDGASYSFIKVVNFYEHKMEFPDGLEYHVSPHGGEFSVPFSTNFQYRFEVDESSKSWITIDYHQTRSEMQDGILNVKVEMNDYEYARMGKIRVIPTNSTGDFYTEIIVNQASAYFSIDQSKYAIPVEGATVETNITSSRGLSIYVQEGVQEWMQASMSQVGADSFTITTTISENESSSKRSGRIELYSTDGDIYLGALEFVQESPAEEAISNMIFEVRANWSNDFTAHLPIAGHYDCYIDWGDGQAEHVTGGNEWDEHINAKIFHVYNVQEPETFTVRISGTVTSLDSEGLKAPCISEVVQWGKTGLQHISGAFWDNYLLEKVCDDPYNALGGVADLNHIFYRCTKLEELPEGLFENCVNIRTANGTFQGCISLKTLPQNLFANCRNLTSMDGTFRNCTSLTDIPEDIFAYNTDLTHCAYLFENCDSLKTVPAGLFRNNINIENIYWTFSGCSSFSIIPEDLFINNTKLRDLSGLFSHCPSLTTIPEGLFRNNKDVNNFNSTFEDCVSLKHVPTGIFDNNRKVTEFFRTFGWCYELEGESPYTIIDGVKYHLYERHLNPDHFVNPLNFINCFAGCPNLAEWESMQRTPWFENWQ